MKKIWEHTYEHELIVDPQENPILTTEPPNAPKKYRKQLAEVFFEGLKVENFYSSVSAVLALYASGKTTGIVLESGEGITHSVPIYQGFAMSFATIKLDMGGFDVTKYLVDLLNKDENLNINFE